MRITADTNLLVRAAVADDPEQARRAMDVLRDATLIAVPLTALCEFAWVLRRTYGFDRAAVAGAIRRLLGARGTVTNRAAAEAGLSALEAGGDFADGVLAHEGAWLGGEVFVSFDRRAVALLERQGVATRLLA